MIAEFTVKNYRSFKKKHTFSLISTKNKELSELNTFTIQGKSRFLKTAVIYGANASGKSNFFSALSFFLYFAVESGPRKQIGDPTETETFLLSKQTEREPSSFELVFYIVSDINEIIRYRYGFSVTEKEVVNEYLFAVYNVREVNLFTREGQEISTTLYFREGSRSKQSVRNNSSFLSVCAQNNGEIAAQIINYLNDLEVTSGLNAYRTITRKEMRNAKYKQQVVDFLKYADIQITDIKSEIMPLNFKENEEPEVMAFLAYLKEKMPDIEEEETFYFGHTVYDGEKPVGKKYLSDKDESAGTIKLFLYAVPILNALKNGTPIFIDEFDTSLHPLIVEAIITLFNSPITNPKNAQLVISCHAVNILTNKSFRRDQVWLCEKDEFGASGLYSLTKYNEPVRNDAAFGKNYLLGKYGAIPDVGKNFMQLQPEDS